MRYIRVAVIIILIIMVLFTAALFQSANSFDRTFYRIAIPRGTSTTAVQKLLESKGILKPGSGFSFAARVLRISRGMQAGEYKFSPSEPLWSILWKLKTGNVVEPEVRRVLVTFPEGTSIYKMGEILKKHKISDPKKFKALVKEGITKELREKHWALFKYMPTESLEGYLYPDSYWIFENATVDQIVETMVSRFEQVVLPFWEKAKKNTDMSLFEVVTLASMIEKEAQVPSEQKIISSVFHNRLKKNMYLASCVTIKYALDNPTKRVYYEQLEIDSPYNTYKNKGLPIGPICNPGINAIKAAVYPAKTNYYYFVAKKDGSHTFSTTWNEHQRGKYLNLR